jgi:hypothetical protein
MKWIKIEDQKPPTGENVLVVKQFLDAPFDEHGYHPDKSFWTTPVIGVDMFFSDSHWFEGGKVTHWMPLPKPPETA